MWLINLDKKIFLWFYNISENKIIFKNIAIKFSYISKFYFYFIYATLLLFLFFYSEISLKIIFVPFSVYILLKFLRIIFKRRRPFLVYPNLNLPKTNKYSFPSNHTGASFILGYTFLYVNLYLGIFSLTIAVILGICRIAQGLHFPLDVISAFIISTFVYVFFIL